MLMSYNTSMFGAKEIAGTHGRLIVGSSLAAFGGPFILGRLRDRASESAMLDLTKKIDPDVLSSEYVCCVVRFQISLSRGNTFVSPTTFSNKHRYGSTSNLTSLIENKALTIPQLMQLAPSETIDPTPFIYDTSLYAAGMAYGIGLASQMMVGSKVSDVYRRRVVGE